MFGRLGRYLGSELRTFTEAVVPLAIPRPGERAAIRPYIRPLADFSDRAVGLADKLNWLMKYGDATTIATRDLALSRTYRIRAKRDLSWAPRSKRNEVADRINLALREFQEGWMIHDHLERFEMRSYPYADFPDPASWLVDQERKLRFESGRHFGSEIYRTLTYLPPKDSKAKVDNVLYVYDDPNANHRMIGAAQARETFEGGIARMISVLSEDFEFTPQGLRTQQFDGRDVIVDDQLSNFMRILTGRRQLVRAVDGAEIIAELLADNLTRLTDGVLRIGDNLIRPLTVLEYPNASTPDILDALEQTPGNFAVSWRWIGRNPEQAQKEMRSLRGRNMQKRESLSDSMMSNPNAMQDPEAVRGANDATIAFGESRSREVSFGYFTMSILAYESVGKDLVGAHTRVSELAERLSGRLRADGFILSTDHDNELEVLLGALPAHGHENVARGMLSSRNLANFLPSVTMWTGEWNAPDTENYGKNAPPLAVFSAHGTTPYALNLHPGGGSNRGGHTLIVGESGSGKTSLAAFIISQHRKYRNSQQIVVDSQFQHYAHLRAVGGRHIILDSHSEEGLSPLAGSAPEDLPLKEKLVSMMLEAQGLDPRQYGEMIFVALSALAEGPPEYQCITGLLSAPGISNPVRKALENYSRKGIAGRILDNPPSEHEDVGLTVFETAGLRSNRAIHGIALVALEMEIDKMCRRRRPTLIVSEEFWDILSHPIGAEIFEYGLKMKRRQGAIYLLITQELADVDRSPIATSVIGATVTKIILPNENATGDSAGRFEKLGLAPWERQALVDHVGERAAYVVQPSGRRMIDTTLGEVSLATLTLSDDPGLARQRAFEEQFGEDWYPEIVANQFDPKRSAERARIAESWRRHAYFYPRRNDERDLPAHAPAHARPHPSDPYGAHIDTDGILPRVPALAE